MNRKRTRKKLVKLRLQFGDGSCKKKLEIIGNSSKNKDVFNRKKYEIRQDSRKVCKDL